MRPPDGSHSSANRVGDEASPSRASGASGSIGQTQFGETARRTGTAARTERQRDIEASKRSRLDRGAGAVVAGRGRGSRFVVGAGGIGLATSASGVSASTMVAGPPGTGSPGLAAPHPEARQASARATVIVPDERGHLEEAAARRRGRCRCIRRPRCGRRRPASMPSMFFAGTVTVTDTSSPRRRASICLDGGRDVHDGRERRALLSARSARDAERRERTPNCQPPIAKRSNNRQLPTSNRHWELGVVGRWNWELRLVHLLRRGDRRKIARRIGRAASVGPRRPTSGVL